MGAATLLDHSATSLLLDGPLGDEVRALYRQRLADEASCVGVIWDRAPARRGRKSICKAIDIDPAHPLSYWSTHPFRVVERDGVTWIAGAVGAPPLKDAMRMIAWTPMAITDVILWNPRTGMLRLADDDGDRLIAPADGGELTVYGDGRAFFRAWADLRADMAHYEHDATPYALPGALLIGNPDNVRWLNLGATVLKPSAGVDPKRIKAALHRQANLPRIAA